LPFEKDIPDAGRLAFAGRAHGIEYFGDEGLGHGLAAVPFSHLWRL
jgi:hypothetical protein